MPDINNQKHNLQEENQLNQAQKEDVDSQKAADYTTAVDLSYVPKAPEVLYSAPKPTAGEQIGSSLSPVKKYAFMFLPEILIFIIFLGAIVFAMNYFNFLPLSRMFPKTFAWLPHSYDVAANKAIVSDVAPLNGSQEYQIEGKFYFASSDKILTLYKNKVVEFLFSSDLSCRKRTILTIDPNTKEINNDVMFCSDLFNKLNYGKNVIVTYTTKPEGLFVDTVYLLE